MGLLTGHRLVLNPSRHDEELTRLEPYMPTTEEDFQRTFRHKKELIFLLVAVPDEFSLDFD